MAKVKSLFLLNGADMASANFIGLVKIYGEDVLLNVKGCEFHFKDSVNKKAKLFGESKEQFKTEALSLLAATTPAAYHAARQSLLQFIMDNQLSSQLTCWLEWWHERHDLIFRAFTSKESLNSNPAEFLHARWKHRDRMGVSLLDATLFDIRDSLLLESMLDGLAQGSYVVGYGPSQGKLKQIRLEKSVQVAESVGKDILDFGVSKDLESTKRTLH